MIKNFDKYINEGLLSAMKPKKLNSDQEKLMEAISYCENMGFTCTKPTTVSFFYFFNITNMLGEKDVSIYFKPLSVKSHYTEDTLKNMSFGWEIFYYSPTTETSEKINGDDWDTVFNELLVGMYKDEIDLVLENVEADIIYLKDNLAIKEKELELFNNIKQKIEHKKSEN